MFNATTLDTFLLALWDAQVADRRIFANTCDIGTLNRHHHTADFYLTEDGKSGFGIKPDGELVAVFSLVRGRGPELMRHAVYRGATRLDCFDGHLPQFYSQHGFVETSRERNWSPGGPDVVFMALPQVHA